MQNTKKILISLSVFLMLVMPALSLAQNASTPTPRLGLVPCSNKPDAKGVIADPCDFNALLTLVNNITHFIFYFMVIPIAAIMFAYAGFELVTSGGSTEQRGMAKKVFTNVLIGLIIAAAAFLIIRTILSILGYQGSWLGFDPY